MLSCFWLTECNGVVLSCFWLTECNGVVLSCFTLSCWTIFPDVSLIKPEVSFNSFFKAIYLFGVRGRETCEWDVILITLDSTEQDDRGYDELGVFSSLVMEPYPLALCAGGHWVAKHVSVLARHLVCPS